MASKEIHLTYTTYMNGPKLMYQSCRIFNALRKAAFSIEFQSDMFTEDAKSAQYSTATGLVMTAFLSTDFPFSMVE